MKRILSGILAFLLVLSLVPATPLIAKAVTSSSGTCGDNLTWIIDSEGTLTISGTGAMPEFLTGSHPGNAPWFTLRSSIKKVVITHGVTSIGRYAFSSCSKLNSIAVPASITSIGDNFVDACYSLTGIWVDTSNRYYSNDAWGVLFNKTKTELIAAPPRSSDGYYIIPDTVTTIGKYAFAFSNVKRVIIPDSVTNIGEYAFLSCESLKTVIMPDSIATIGVGTFENCNYSQIDIWYTGNEAQKNNIAGIEELAYCTWHYNSCYAGFHIYDDSANDVVCTVCGYICAQMYENECDTSCGFCGRTRQVPDHVYDNACDTTCNICNYERPFYGHVYTDTYDLTCNICKQTLAPAPPTLESVTDTTVTLVAIAGYEYSVDGYKWQTNTVFTGLLPATSYYFYQRVAESSENHVSPSSLGLKVKTDKSIPAAPPIPTVWSSTDTSVTLAAVSGYEYSMDGSTWQQSNTFTGLEAATQYTFYQRLAETDTSYASSNSPALMVTTRMRTGTITYDANGGEYAPAVQYKAEGVVLTLTADKPTYSYHIFMGWATAPYADITYQPGSSYLEDADITLYAMWLPECSECNGKGKVTVTCFRCSGSGKRPASSKSHCCKAGVTGGLALGGDPTKTYCLLCKKPCSVDFDMVDCPKTVIEICGTCDGNCYSSHKLENNCALPVAVLGSKTNCSITLVGSPYFQYSLDGINWQDSPSFNNLEPATQYAFYQRYKETRTLQASPASNALLVTTENSKLKPAAPIISSYTDTKVTLVPIDGGEYSMDGETWQSSNVFEGLSPVTKYTFYQRYAATDDLWPSPVSDGKSVTTDKAIQPAVPAVPTVTEVTNRSVTLQAVSGCEYSMDGTTWQASPIFTGLSAATEYTFYQRYTATSVTHAGKSSAGLQTTTKKNTQSRPSTPTLNSKTHNTVSLNPVWGYEYSKDGINWQRSYEFTNLDPSTTYIFYQRKYETEDAYASEPSFGFSVRTDDPPPYTPGDVTGDGKINSLDGLMLLRYLNGWNVNIVSPEAMDVNADGKINSLDGLILMRYLNGWNVILG